MILDDRVYRETFSRLTGKTQKSLAESAMAYASLKETVVTAPVAELV